MITEEPLTHGHTARHIRSGVTLVLLLALVIGAAWYGWKAVTAEPTTTTTSASDAGAKCGVPPQPANPGDIEVNVYNGTSRNGLAKTTAEQVTQNGFVVLNVDNDPQGERVTDVAIVRGAKNSENAYLLLAYVPGARFVADGRADPTLDLVVGDMFQAVTAPAAPPQPVIMC
jgi:LytR cell envelope-related transcriptional attenuator